jgi:ATP-dependent Lhr-like helicase
MKDGRWRVANPMVAQQYRLNVGTIVEATMLKVRLARAKSRYGGRVLGEVEEYFVETMSPGDTFVFAGEVLEYQAILGEEVHVQRSASKDPRVPSYEGGKFPLSTFLASRVRAMLASPERWGSLPDQVHEWLSIQQERSRLPGREDLLVETFPRGDRHYLVAYPFEGRLAHQTLGMLLTRRLERARLRPLGFVANDYALACYGLEEVTDPAALFSPDILEHEFVDWVQGSHLLRRAFREVAVIGGLVERQHPGKRKTGRQVTFSTDLIYDVLRKYEPDHLLMRAAWADARTRMTDVGRLADLLDRAADTMLHVRLDRVSPLAVPVLVMIGRESVAPGSGADDAILIEAEALAREAMRLD